LETCYGSSVDPFDKLFYGQFNQRFAAFLFCDELIVLQARNGQPQAQTINQRNEMIDLTSKRYGRFDAVARREASGFPRDEIGFLG
jgi:hypothetical protein